MKLIGLGAGNLDVVKNIRANISADPHFEFLGFVDNDEKKWGMDFWGFPVLGGMDVVEEMRYKDVYFCNFITRDPETRFKTTRQLIKRGARLANLIYPDISLDMVKMGVGNYIQAGVYLSGSAEIGNNVAIAIGTYISHEDYIGDHCFISFCCNISGRVRIEEGVYIGVGATIMPDIHIGEWSIVGAHSLVTRDVEPYTVVWGVSATKMRKNTPSLERVKV